MRRRDFIAGLTGLAAAWPLQARAQQPAMPVIGLLDTRSPDGMTDRLRAFREGLKDNGYVERQVAARSGEAGHKTKSDGVFADKEDDGDSRVNAVSVITLTGLTARR